MFSIMQIYIGPAATISYLLMIPPSSKVLLTFHRLIQKDKIKPIIENYISKKIK